MLSSNDHLRYSRQTTIPGFGLEAQEKLKHSSVLVVGAGGLGSPVLLYLVAAGLGKIGIVENDTVDLSNLQRQVLFTEKNVQESKLDKAHARLKEMNSATEFVLFPERLDSENALKIASDFDLIIDCTDNFPTRYLVNDVCEILNKPFIYGALHRFEGQAAVFNFNDSCTYRDLFENPPNEEMAPNCETAGVLGSVAGIVGTIMATEAIKVITDIGEPLTNQLLLIDTQSMVFRKMKLQKNPKRPKITSLIDYDAFCGIQAVSEIKASAFRKKDFEQIIDVRTQQEYYQVNIGGKLIPLISLHDNLDRISKVDKTLVHCQSGIRSKQAILELEKLGFTNLVNLEGGINALISNNPEELL
ncbi:adenylyltransferase and sulfurtransferase [Spirosomataceae bacterium TFI 002]|nr:adenylyltransferase and sulfurtransferase [Spirosomataceae bacterium TFI 002]